MSHFPVPRSNQTRPYFDPHLGDKEGALVLRRQDHTGFFLAALCEKT